MLFSRRCTLTSLVASSRSLLYLIELSGAILSCRFYRIHSGQCSLGSLRDKLSARWTSERVYIHELAVGSITLSLRRLLRRVPGPYVLPNLMINKRSGKDEDL